MSLDDAVVPTEGRMGHNIYPRPVTPASVCPQYSLKLTLPEPTAIKFRITLIQ
jgi:hypothetical protein